MKKLIAVVLVVMPLVSGSGVMAQAAADQSHPKDLPLAGKNIPRFIAQQATEPPSPVWRSDREVDESVAQSQQTAEPPSPVWRMVHYRIKPGQTEAFWNDFRENGAPIFNRAKEEGILADFMLFSNPYKAAPEEWDALLMLKYQNWAGLDAIEARASEFYFEHYGAERLKTLEEERAAMREVLSNRAVRGVQLP